MADFPNLAALRRGLTTDDADQRGQAYQAVLQADVQPSEVLGADPAEETVEALESADVIPEGSGSGGGRGRRVDEREEEIVELLKEIRDNTGGA